jgi:lysyl-tRNA synthetase class 2
VEQGHEVVRERLRKLAALEAAGTDPYPSRPPFPIADLAGELQAAHAGAGEPALAAAGIGVALAGRLIAWREHGKSTFAHLRDRTGRLQLYLRQDVLGAERYAWLRALEVGDFVAVRGTLFRTRTGELTVAVREIACLAKALRPLPEKWHGLRDTETRYRQRYLDLLANQETAEVFRRRSRLVAELRRFFDARGFLEVETPMMQVQAGGATARPFVTHHAALDLDLYLRIAPELYLKRLVVGGFERVYELNRNFRNEGISALHNPEFTMLEFYQAYADYRDLMDLTEVLIPEVARAVVGGEQLSYRGRAIDLRPPWPRLTLLEALVKIGGLEAAALEGPDGARAAAAARGIPLPAGAGWGQGLVALFERLVEPELVQPTFIYDFPLAVSPLAKRHPDDPRMVQRFELFIAGLELANAYSELNDPRDQRARFEAQLAQRAAGDEQAHAMDEDYLCALEHGLPPTAGEGIGVDRLAMLLTDAPSIRDVIPFPHLRPVPRPGPAGGAAA